MREMDINAIVVSLVVAAASAGITSSARATSDQVSPSNADRVDYAQNDDGSDDQGKQTLWPPTLPTVSRLTAMGEMASALAARAQPTSLGHRQLHEGIAPAP
jgi:hypothetical protein